MNKQDVITIEIESIDSLGQGVGMHQGQRVFVSKVLPGEQCKVRVLKRKKGVMFAQLMSVETASDQRVGPACEHFDQCVACDFLHTSYEQELSYKQQALENAFLPLSSHFKESLVLAEVVKAEHRLGYRNRVQLHYDKQGSLGFIDGLSNQIVSVPECQIIDARLQKEFDNLYISKNEEKVGTNKQKGSRHNKKRGHYELYLKAEESTNHRPNEIEGENNAVQISKNQDYANQGFTQVNQAMNQQLIESVTKIFEQCEAKHVLDLFSGKGNLSNHWFEHQQDNSASRLMVDYTPFEHDDFVAMDLFADVAPKRLKKITAKRNIDTCLIDPPRAGFAWLDQCLTYIKPKHLVYVSCNVETMVRDLKQLPCQFEIKNLTLIDMFPSTRHFETLAHIECRYDKVNSGARAKRKSFVF